MEINEIRTIFLKYWDPILIGDNELLIDEYDNYVNSMFDYLKGDQYWWYCRFINFIWKWDGSGNRSIY